jgi:hypothetical protein
MIEREASPVSTARIIIAVVLATALIALITLVLAAGWANDKARPGTTGRVPVSTPVTDRSR